MINISTFEQAIEKLQESLSYTRSEIALNNKGLAKQFNLHLYKLLNIPMS